MTMRSVPRLCMCDGQFRQSGRMYYLRVREEVCYKDARGSNKHNYTSLRNFMAYLMSTPPIHDMYGVLLEM